MWTSPRHRAAGHRGDATRPLAILHTEITCRAERGLLPWELKFVEKTPRASLRPPRKQVFVQRDPLLKLWSQQAFGVTAEVMREGARASASSVGSSAGLSGDKEPQTSPAHIGLSLKAGKAL